ncbi:MAG: hypothetical protein WCS37_20410, partial [Chloroflexota bacterium]
IYHETGWSNALNIAMTQVASKAFEVTGYVPIHVKRSQELLLNSEGGDGWIDLLLKALLDYSTTDNGLFIEIERETKSPLSKVTGLWVLDSLRCYRTGNPEYPVVYTDIDGANHSLAQHQVIAIADTPQSNPRWRGIGLCAASRCYKSILLMIAIERYFYEKITGQRPLGIHFVSGMSDKQLEAAVEHAKNQNYAKGVQQYQGALVVALMGDTEPKIATVDFASLPDRFDRAYEVSLANRRFASALGFSVDELEPQTGNALGTGAQAQVQFRRDQRKGLAALEPRLIHQLHQKVLPKSVSYTFVSRDLDDSLKEADLKSKQIAGYIPAVEKQVITPLQALQQLVEEKVFPKTFLAGQAELQDRSLTDTERSEDLNNNPTTASSTAAGVAQPQPQPQPDATENPVQQQQPTADQQPTQTPPDQAQAQNSSSNTPMNLVVLGNDVVTKKTTTTTTTKKEGGEARIDNPGARGGKFWYDENGTVQYGPPPKGIQAKSLEERKAEIFKNVSTALATTQTPEDFKAKGWALIPGATGGAYHASSAAAIAIATPLAAKNPKITVAVKPVKGKGFAVATRPTTTTTTDKKPSQSNDQRMPPIKFDFSSGPTSSSSGGSGSTSSGGSGIKKSVEPGNRKTTSGNIAKSREPSQYANRGNITGPVSSSSSSKKEARVFVGKKRVGLAPKVVELDTRELIAKEYPKALNLVEQFKN